MVRVTYKVHVRGGFSSKRGTYTTIHTDTLDYPDLTSALDDIPASAQAASSRLCDDQVATGVRIEIAWDADGDPRLPR